MTFSKFFEQIAWGSMTLVALYAASQLKELSQSVNSLNTNVAVIVEKLAVQDRIQNETRTQVGDIQLRVLELERRVRR